MTSINPVGPATYTGANRRGFAVAAAVAVALAGVPISAPAQAAGRPWSEVVVTGVGAEQAAHAVEAVGGRVLAVLPVVRGVAARLPLGSALGPEWTVAPQRAITVAAAASDGAGTATTVRQMLGLPAKGDEGRGVTVAVVDTGIANVPDLAGRVTRRVDLTGTGGGDGYGHGTFMAGVIAASGAASGGAYRGVAPAAELVDVKVADAQGRTDLVTVLRGLQWVSDHRKDVQVLNLSLSSRSPLPYQLDPLNRALESLWRDGVTVVVPAGNDGPEAGTVTSPGNDPLLLTAGGLDAAGTTARTDDVVASWSGRGPTWQGDAKPELVAPGSRIVSLRSPGSAIDAGNPQARIGDAYFRGSGTSMATAVTSGVIAATLAVQPRLNPDAVKNLLVTTTYANPALTAAAGAGAGGLDAGRVLAAAPGWPTGKAQRRFDEDTDTLRRDAKRWSALAGAIAAGDRAAATREWNALTPPSRDWAARSWAALDPAARAWAARSWAANGWTGADDDWAGRAWAARVWATRAWADDAWSARARAWADAEWSARARAWADEDWSARARAWADVEWSARARAWADAEWSARARAWADVEWSARARAWADADWAARARAWADAEWSARARAWADDDWSARSWAWLPSS
ncbi:subtilase family protein [Krasilnikovia cinnamomea]|uniref:Subtilase family protein n=1 Tax=Krasilnikovia cinnamomea TaxID=349313 RepID=A0A4Q7ZU38_9ACTN|nr:S8 family peptidase [Krasilnikovia cinnamomea]RZU54133.1 subtilase family protein [Krasilnikovia cinnamomea]